MTEYIAESLQHLTMAAAGVYAPTKAEMRTWKHSDESDGEYDGENEPALHVIPRKSDWAREYQELKDLLTPEEYEAARASTPNAHYTSALVIKEIWTALEHMGFRGGRVLEPAAGVGHFLGLQPSDTIGTGRGRTAVELDPVTGRILTLLYPKAHVRVQGFETIHLPDNFFEVVVGNVPFGDFGVTDRTPNARRYAERGLDRKIHDYFLAKSLDKLRPGGVMAVITSTGTMDKIDKGTRAYLAERGELLRDGGEQLSIVSETQRAPQQFQLSVDCRVGLPVIAAPRDVRLDRTEVDVHCAPVPEVISDGLDVR